MLIILLLAVTGLWLRSRLASAQAVNPEQYQAVFLNNGQVYFGKLADPDARNYIVLRNIYYLQTEDENVQPADKPTDQQLSLVKLGSELHGPEDVMHIKADQVLFWENLKNDSQVVKAINAQNGQ